MKRWIVLLIVLASSAAEAETDPVSTRAMSALRQCQFDCTIDPMDARRQREKCVAEFMPEDADAPARNRAYAMIAELANPDRRGGVSCGPAFESEVGLTSEEWVARFNTDPMDDTRHCIMVPRVGSEQASPFILLNRDGWGVVLSGDEYPGEPMKIRVDKNAMQASANHNGFYGPKAKAVITQMRAGNSVLTEMIEWPSGAPVRWSGSLTGFSSVADKCQAWVTKGVMP